MNILVTGGAGYIGSRLVPLLLQNGHKVKVLDKLLFGGRGLLPIISDPNFSFVQGDVAHEKTWDKDLLDGIDLIVNLAAIVGYPACRKNPVEAQATNVQGMRNILNVRDGRMVIQASTCSNYGFRSGGVCDEDTELRPLTEYGDHKVEAEKMLMDTPNSIALRIATAYGTSNRMRFDLMVNDFTRKAILERTLIIYEKDYVRAFIHVHDIVRAYLHAINNFDTMKDTVYNVGNRDENITKEDLVNLIAEQVDFQVEYMSVGKDEDQRNYAISYKRFDSTGFNTETNLRDGIRAVVTAVRLLPVFDEFRNA